MSEKGKLIVISGPSGAGKSTVVFKAIEGRNDFCFSTSVTTRSPRPGEVDGREYFFIDRETYDRMVEQDELLEHAEYVTNGYGTPRAFVEQKLNEGLNVVLDIDPQGAKQVMAQWPDCVSIFILPPSYAELKKRLFTRNTDDPVEIERRLNNARGEIKQIDRYRYLIVNDNLELAFEQLVAIVRAEKQNTVRYFPVIEE